MLIPYQILSESLLVQGGVLVCLAALVLFGSLWVIYRRRLALRRLTTVQSLCRLLLDLVVDLQQHRGMSSALLAGDGVFARQLSCKGGEIDGLLSRFEGLLGREQWLGQALLPREEIRVLLARWRHLRTHLASLSVEQSLVQHGLLIAQLLKWLALLGEQRIAVAADELAALRLRNYLFHLPALSEFLGQTRALGTSVAARSRCSAIERVRLMFLLARAEALLNQVLESGVVSPVALQAAQGVHEMARVVRTRMLLSSGIVIDAKGFYTIATQAINGIFAWIAAVGEDAAGGQLALA